jgi:hypothetical protein
MAKHPSNRLNSLWPKEASSGYATALSDAKQLAEKLQPVVENVGAAIAGHPRTSLTIAATLGAGLGWFIKRK